MNILQVHKYYWYKDGASNYALRLSEKLEERGHKVIPFSMHNENNLPSEYSKYFVDEMDFQDPSKISFFNKFKYAFKMIYSFEAKKKIKKLLDENKIDLVHIHNIYHHITPSIFHEIKKRGIPIVMTLHDYKLIVPNYSFFHHGAIHEEDAKGWYFSCIKNKCMKDSLMQSIIVTIEMIWHHKIMKYYERCVDKFIAPSKFLMNKCIAYGQDKNKFVNIVNPIDTKKFTIGNEVGNYVAYIGRLSEEKGVDVLLKAAQKTPEINYRLIGKGPQEEYLKKMSTDLGLKNLEFVGFKTGEELKKMLFFAKLLVLPTIIYENYPLSVLEAQASGKIVLGSRMGGIPELIDEEFLFENKDIEGLVEKIKYVFSFSKEKILDIGKSLRDRVIKNNDMDKHVENMLDLYQELINKD